MIRVLFVSHSKRGAFYYNDASARYRCVFPAEHLNDLDIKTNVIHFDEIEAIQLSDYSHVIFHRPQYSLKLKFYVKRLKARGAKVIADFDDLLFNPELANQSAAVQAGYMSQALAKKHSQAYKKALTLFSYCWVSTTELEKELKACLPNIETQVCYNKLPKRWTQLQTVTPWQERLNNKLIRYMPGTSHHKHDFKKIEDFLVKLLIANPDIKLEVVGELSFNTNAFPQAQISQQPHMSFEQLPSAIHTSWLTLAPLETNVFNQCKSGLKFWESGLYGVPVISSELEDIQRFKNPGLCISNNMQEWLYFIESMKEPDTYKNACDHARKHASHSVFNLDKTDERLLGIHHTKAISNVELKRNVAINYKKQQLIMCATIGPRWPAIMLDPINNKHKKTNELIKIQENFNNTLSETEIDAYILMGDLESKLDKPIGLSNFKRKLKKLWYSPGDFFKDIKFTNNN